MRHVGIALILLAAAGCITRSFTPTLRYTVDPVIDAAKAEPTERSLAVRTFEPARQYTQKICFRDAGHALGTYANAEWAEFPADVVTRAVTDAIIATGRFKDVGDAVNMAQPELKLTGELRKFDEVRTTDPWTAECVVRVELREALGPNALWAGTLSAQVPLEKNDTTALASAMSKAVSQVAAQAAAEIAKQ